MNQKFIVPAIVGALAICIVLILFFAVVRPAQESISLSVSSMQNEANALSAVVNEPGTGSGTPGQGSTVPQPQDALTALRAIPEASTFVSLLEETGVTAQLSPNGTYTFFVPTNAAFAASPLGPIASMSAVQKLRLAEYHIVSGKMMSISAVKAGSITMLSGDALNADVFDTAQLSGNSHIIATYPAPDGIIYLIDIVLQPPVVRPYPF